MEKEKITIYDPVVYWVIGKTSGKQYVCVCCDVVHLSTCLMSVLYAVHTLILPGTKTSCSLTVHQVEALNDSDNLFSYIIYPWTNKIKLICILRYIVVKTWLSLILSYIFFSQGGFLILILCLMPLWALPLICEILQEDHFKLLLVINSYLTFFFFLIAAWSALFLLHWSLCCCAVNCLLRIHLWPSQYFVTSFGCSKTPQTVQHSRRVGGHIVQHCIIHCEMLHEEKNWAHICILCIKSFCQNIFEYMKW